jgi:hypothetical protein
MLAQPSRQKNHNIKGERHNRLVQTALAARTYEQNMELQAMKFSYTTPGLENTCKFDHTREHICVDIGASASISTMKSNILKAVNNNSIQGIYTE